MERMTMALVIEAVYERGVFRPLGAVELSDGQRVSLSYESQPLTLEEAETSLREWQEVYRGLTPEEVSEVESIALDRSNFAPDRPFTQE
jgi:predicted DNA-binding antitoxin AbrB/MazE fold protein